MTRNAILCILDDAHFDCFSKMGFLSSWATDDAYETVHFPNCFVGYSLCTPSRFTMQTGRFAVNHGCLSHLDPDSTDPISARVGYVNNGSHTLFARLRRKGLDVDVSGKIYNRWPFDFGDDESPPGVTRLACVLDDHLLGGIHAAHTGPAYYNYYVNEATGVVGYRNGASGDGNPSHSSDTWTTTGSVASGRQSATSHFVDHFGRRSRQFLEDVAGRRRFFCYFAPFSPHRQIDPANRHDGLTASVFGAIPINSPSRSAYFNEPDGPIWQSRPAWLKVHPETGAPFTDGPGSAAATYDTEQINAWKVCQAVDEWLFDVKAILEAAGEWDNTDIIVINDNGFNNGNHRWHGKGVAYLDSLKTSLFFRHPGLGASRIDTGLVMNVDVAPTIDEVTGGPSAFRRAFDGMSLLRRAQDSSVNWRTQTFHEFTSGEEATIPGYRGGIFDLGGGDLFLYTELVASGSFPAEQEMYQLSQGEGFNLAKDPAYATALAVCAQRLKVMPVAA